MSTPISAAQSAQQNNRCAGGKYAHASHAEPEALVLAPVTDVSAIWSVTRHGAMPGFGRRKPLPAFWVASSRGGTFSFTSEDAAHAFIESPRGKAVNAGPKPLIDENIDSAVALVLASRGSLARVSQGKMAVLNRALGESRENDLGNGLRLGICQLTGLDLAPAERMPTSVSLSVSSGRRDIWAQSVLEDSTASRGQRIGQLFAGLVVAGEHRAFRFRP